MEGREGGREEQISHSLCLSLYSQGAGGNVEEDRSLVCFKGGREGGRVECLMVIYLTS